MTALIKTTEATPHIPHYFGNIVRRLFILVGLIILFVLPFFKNFLPVANVIVIIAVVFLGTFAAMTNPLLPSTNRVNVAIAAIGLVVFENMAVSSYGAVPFEQSLLYQALAIIFLFALYFGVKTLRAMSLGQITPETVQGEGIEENETEKENRVLIAQMKRTDEVSEKYVRHERDTKK